MRRSVFSFACAALVSLACATCAYAAEPEGALLGADSEEGVALSAASDCAISATDEDDADDGDAYDIASAVSAACAAAGNVEDATYAVTAQEGAEELASDSATDIASADSDAVVDAADMVLPSADDQVKGAIDPAATSVENVIRSMQSRFRSAGIPAYATVVADRVESGAYTIESDESGYLDISGSAASAQTIEENYAADQRFSIDMIGVDSSFEWYYAIENVGSGAVIASGNAAGSTADLLLRGFSGTDAQLWYIRSPRSGADAQIVNKATGLALDIVGGRIVGLSALDDDTASWSLHACEPEIENGAYVIESTLPGDRVLDVKGASSNTAAPIQIYSGNDTAAQAFAFTYDANTGYYTITNYGSGLVLAVSGGSTTVGAALMQEYGNASAAQLWQVVRNADGTYTIYSALTGFVFDISGGVDKNVTPIVLYTGNESDAQRFQLRSTVPAAPQLSDSGVVVIRNGSNAQEVMEVEGGSRTDGAALQVGDAVSGAFSQKYKLLPYGGADGNGAAASGGASAFLIQSIGSGLYVTAADNGAIVQCSRDEALRQVWAMVPLDNGHYALVVVDGSRLDTSLVLGATATGAGADLVAADRTTAPYSWSLVATPLLEEGLYTFSLAANEELLLDVANASFDSGANVQLWTDSGNNAQKFYLRGAGNGTYILTNAWSLLNVDVAGAVAGPGVNVQQYFVNDGVAQQWYIEWSSAGGFVLRSALGWYSLAATGTTPASNAQLAAYNPNDLLQVFRLTPATLSQVGFSERIAVLDVIAGSGLTTFRSSTGLSQQTINDLWSCINSYYGAGRRVGFVLIDLNTGSGVAYNADEYFYSASTIKGPYVVALNKYWPWELQNWSGVMWRTIDISSNGDYATLRNVFGSTPLGMFIDETHAWGFDYSMQYVTYTPRDLTKLWVGMADYLMSDEQNAWWCRDVFDSNGSITSRSALSWKGCTIYAKSGWVTGSVHNEGCLVMDGDNPYVMVVMTTDYWGNPTRMVNLMNVLDRAHSELIA